jgi:hypothetical protein
MPRTRSEAIEDLRLAIGRAFDVGIGDVGAWTGEERLWAGFYDGQKRRPRSFAAVVDEAGRITWWEEGAAGAAA